MEKLVGKIIEIENMAQNIMHSARDRQENFDREMKAEIERMRADYIEHAKRRIAIVAETEQQSLAERMDELEVDYAHKSERLEQRCGENFDRWVAELTDALSTP